jgi:CDP-diacylglycerol--glycerol-3-phosphate 3-phosphatidyltransferase
MINLPNLLTFIRILLVPVFILLFLAPGPVRSFLSAMVFLAASLTDLLDGYLARRWEQVTKLGKLLDPIADKLLVLSALVLLVQFQRVPGWIAIVLIGRELGMTGLRAIASSDGIIIPAEKTGKYKFAVQITALVMLITDLRLKFLDFHLIGTVLLWAAMVLSVISAVQYAVYYGNQMQTKKVG